MKAKLKPGDLAYRVTERDEHDSTKPCTWYVASVSVKSASDRQIILVKTFPIGTNGSSFRTRFEPEALGRSFFTTPEQAVHAFFRHKEESIAKAKRTIVDGLRALEWARHQLGLYLGGSSDAG